MNPKFLILLLVVILATAWFLLLSPLFDDIKSAKSNLEVQEQIYRTKKAEADQLRELVAQYELMGDEKNKLDEALPIGPKIEEILVEIEALVKRSSGVLMTSFSFNQGAGPGLTRASGDGQEGVQSLEKVGRITLNLSLTSTYKAFKNFLKLCEKEIRIVDIQNISFSAPEAKSSQSGESLAQLHSFTLSMDTYFYYE